MSEFVKVARIGDVPDPGKMILEVDDRLVVLVHIGGSYFCIDDICTHDGGTLGEGRLEGEAICCPRHGAKFNVKTGEALTMPATESTHIHEVRLENDEVFVCLNEET